MPRTAGASPRRAAASHRRMGASPPWADASRRRTGASPPWADASRRRTGASPPSADVSHRRTGASPPSADACSRRRTLALPLRVSPLRKAGASPPSAGASIPRPGAFPSPIFVPRTPQAAWPRLRRRRGAPAGGGESANGPRRGRGASSRNADSRGAWRAAPRRCFEVGAPTSCGGRCRPAPPDGAPRDSRRRPGDFAGFSRRRGSGSGFGAGRQRIRILPRCWTGAASRLSQIPARCASRSSRSSECTRTLTSSCAPSATSISCSTVGESPAWPIATTGWSGCARARSSRRCDGVSVIMRRV